MLLQYPVLLVFLQTTVWKTEPMQNRSLKRLIALSWTRRLALKKNGTPENHRAERLNISFWSWTDMLRFQYEDPPFVVLMHAGRVPQCFSWAMCVSERASSAMGSCWHFNDRVAYVPPLMIPIIPKLITRRDARVTLCPPLGILWIKYAIYTQIYIAREVKSRARDCKRRVMSQTQVSQCWDCIPAVVIPTTKKWACHRCTSLVPLFRDQSNTADINKLIIVSDKIFCTWWTWLSVSENVFKRETERSMGR